MGGGSPGLFVELSYVVTREKFLSEWRALLTAPAPYLEPSPSFKRMAVETHWPSGEAGRYSHPPPLLPFLCFPFTWRLFLPSTGKRGNNALKYD